MAINLYAFKGGVGTSTMSVAIATLLESTLHAPNHKHDDVHTIMGRVENKDHVYDMGREGEHPVRDDVYDRGRNECYTWKPAYKDTNVLVCENSFQALRASVTGCGDVLVPDWVIVLHSDTRALGKDDVTDVLSTVARDAKFSFVRHTPEVARAIDAGLFSSRMPRTVTEDLSRFIREHEHGLIEARKITNTKESA
jgi:hypothetical protein